MDTKVIIGIAIAVLTVTAVILSVLRQKKTQSQAMEQPPNGFSPWMPEPTAVENVPSGQPQPVQSGMGTVPLMPENPQQFSPSPRQSPAGYTLTAISGALKGQSFPLGNGEILLGRGTDCRIRFPADTAGVSGRHCALSIAPGGTVTLTDVGSTYGTYLSNGQRLIPNCPQPIHPGDTFLLAGLDGPAFLLEAR